LELVVDANVLFSFFKVRSPTRKLVIASGFKLYAPEFALTELESYCREVSAKAKMSLGAFELFKTVMKWFVTFITDEEYKGSLQEAKSLTPDPKDVAYFALALKFNCPIWSNDKALKEQSVVKVFSTSELINELGL